MTTPTGRLYPPASLQLTLRLLQDGQEAAVVLGAGSFDGIGFNQALADAWRDGAWNAFRPVISSGVTCVGAILRETYKPEGLVQEAGPPATAAGSQTGVVAIAGACTLIRWTTTRGGRSGKGRTFLPGLIGGSVSAGGRTYTTAHQTAVNTAVSAYLTSGHWTTHGIEPAILSFTKGVASTVTSGALASVVGIQRRRMR